jgi:hypothetical protein
MTIRKIIITSDMLRSSMYNQLQRVSRGVLDVNEYLELSIILTLRYDIELWSDVIVNA